MASIKELQTRLDNKTFDNWMKYCYSIKKNGNDKYVNKQYICNM